MEELLQNLIISQVYAFLLVFTRIGTAMMVMPGTGDSFVPARVRLLFALTFTVMMTPFLGAYLPEFNQVGVGFLLLLLGEFIIGLFIGTIARIFVTALDTAGMFISMHMGLANAQIFNPASAVQGSIMGAFLAIMGTVLLMVTNLHHVLIISLVESYVSLPVGMKIAAFSGDFAQMTLGAVAKAFSVGFQFAMPFIVVTMMIYVSMGILARLMPQLQVFILSIPIQVSVGLIVFILVMSGGMIFWMKAYEDAIRVFIYPLVTR